MKFHVTREVGTLYQTVGNDRQWKMTDNAWGIPHNNEA